MEKWLKKYKSPPTTDIQFCSDSYIQMYVLYLYLEAAVGTVFEPKYSTRGLLKMGFSVFEKKLEKTPKMAILPFFVSGSCCGYSFGDSDFSSTRGILKIDFSVKKKVKKNICWKKRHNMLLN